VNILYLAHRLPYPPNKGDKIRSFNTIKHLASEHAVCCVCFIDDPADLEHVDALREYCVDVVALPLSRSAALVRGLVGLAAGQTLTAAFYRHPAMIRAIHGLARLARFDVVFIYSSGMGQYGCHIDAPVMIMDLCDLDSQKWRGYARRCMPPKSWLLNAEARRLNNLERALVDRFDSTLLIGGHEAEEWEGVDRSKLHFIGNGVDVPDLDAPPVHDTGVVGFIGDMRYYPNEEGVCWFVREVWPAVSEAVSHAEFQIVGRGPSRRVRRLARVAGVKVLGEVPRILEHLQQFQVSVAPLRIARGIQNKVLEAMAAARPVVATSPAARGIRVPNREGLLVADDAAGFAERLVELLKDPALCRVLGDSARVHVRRAHDWPSQMRRLLTLIDEQLIVAPRAAPRCPRLTRS
jgi:sugar transferase (PEP-CTERM/EpsH1 system associated)